MKITRDSMGRFAGKFRRIASDAWFKTRVVLVAIFLMGFGYVWISWAEAPAPVEAEETATSTIEYVTVKEEVEAPVLDRICGCESEGNRNSRGSQFDKKGKLRKLVNIHEDGSTSTDIGACMINDYYHEANAVKLGFNIYEEAGNRAMAEWLFLHEGTEPWKATRSCWK